VFLVNSRLGSFAAASAKRWKLQIQNHKLQINLKSYIQTHKRIRLVIEIWEFDAYLELGNWDLGIPVLRTGKAYP